MNAVAMKTNAGRQVTLNVERELYIIPCGSGFSCLGFRNCFEESYALAALLKQELPKEEEYGTLAVYQRRSELLTYVAKKNIDLGTWYNPNTPLAVREILNSLMHTGRRVRIFKGSRETGKVWNNEYDVIGSIGRSTGILKMPLLIASGRSSGGGAILTDCILRIVDVETKRDLYRASNYTESKFDVEYTNDTPGYASCVKVDGEIHARFKKPGQAERWVDFMKGNRMAK